MKYLLFALLVLKINSITYSQLPNSNMTLLSNKNEYVSGTAYSAVWGYTAPNGREYAILGCPEGTAFYDITDTMNIHLSGYTPGMTNSWREMKTFSHYAYVVSEADGSGLQIVDLQYLPDSVHLVNTFLFSGYTKTHTISQEGPYLYMNGGNYGVGGTFVLDLTSNPVLPVKRGDWELGYIHDCRVINDTIWGAGVFDGHIRVINATNKNNLVEITSWLNVPEPGPHNTALSADHKFLFVTDEIAGNPRVLKVWNVANVMNPIQVATWQPTGITTSIVHNIETYGNYAIVAHYTSGVRMLNITNPSLPVEIAWYDTYPADNSFTYNGCWGVYMFPSGKIAASDRQTGLYVLRSTALPIGINSNGNELPLKFRLAQNYPNPFNPSTTIEYSLPENAYTKLKVFDITGKQMALLIDKMETAGNHSVSYDASGLSSGVYLYTIETGEYYETRKMILIK
ncbi:MAG: choice-of-anchor B family protein [Ignavibacteria bacterium]|nr:choice-of-anchor B family protein [Ignavibacteria bacterium]